VKLDKAITIGWAALLFALVPHLNAQISVRDRSPVLRTDVAMVLVPVTVTDHRGANLNGLDQKSFTILDDKVPQKIVSFTNEDCPSSVGIVLDISGSMRNTLRDAKEVAQTFVRTMNSDDEFLLLTVSTEPAVTQGFITDTETLARNIDSTRTGGMTALIDTVYLGLNRMRDARQPRRALLILSDGIDNQSRYTQAELLRMALEADVQIYTIIFENGASGGVPTGSPFRPSMVGKPGDMARQQQQGSDLLEKLSEKTGGLHFHVRSQADAKEAAVKAGQALHSQYVIGYHAPESGSGGKWHRVQVKLDKSEAQVYARTGYYER
jgi:Ca-activated chloride channel family protein